MLMDLILSEIVPKQESMTNCRFISRKRPPAEKRMAFLTFYLIGRFRNFKPRIFVFSSELHHFFAEHGFTVSYQAVGIRSRT